MDAMLKIKYVWMKIMVFQVTNQHLVRFYCMANSTMVDFGAENLN